MSTNVVETHGLAKYYGRRRGLESLDMEVRAGEVYGFLGPNGAGKTTAIRVLLDLIRPTAGRAQVFGQSPRAGGASLRRRIGYLAGDFIVDGGQTSRQLLEHLARLRGGLPNGRIEQHADRLELDLDVRIGSLSRGNSMRNVEPSPGVESKCTLPPCSWMVLRVISSPMPVPSCEPLVLKKLVKTFFLTS